MSIFKRLKLVIIPLFIIPLLIILAKNSKAEPVNHIVMSEIQIGGTTATDEFVELYNPTNTTINLDGWKLTKKISTGTESNLVASMSGSILPYHYFLITHPTGYLGQTQKDYAYSSTSYSTTSNNTVLLYSDNGTNVVDKVGMGTAVDFEGAQTIVPPNNSSITRINNQDTDNNLNDFILTSDPNPQNSSFIETTPTPTTSPEPTADAGTPMPTNTAIPTESPTSFPTETPSPTPNTQTPSPTPTLISSPIPTASPEPTADARTPTPTTVPFGWSKSPVFICSNSHVPSFVYAILKIIMPNKFHCN